MQTTKYISFFNKESKKAKKGVKICEQRGQEKVAMFYEGYRAAMEEAANILANERMPVEKELANG